MNKIKNIKTYETTYEDNTYWVEYEFQDNHKSFVAYDIVNGKNTVKELEKEYNDDVLDSKITNKIKQLDLSKDLFELIYECLTSENEMWFIEWDELYKKYETKEEINVWLNELQKEVEKLGLDEYIKFNEDGCAITVYGGVITQILFEKNSKNIMYLVVEFKVITEPIYETGCRTWLFRSEKKAKQKQLEIINENLENNEDLEWKDKDSFCLESEYGSFCDVYIEEITFED